MVERIKVSYRNSAYYVDRPNWDGGDVVMAADYDELEAEIERTKKWYLDAIEQRDKYARLWDEALSRTGAVKVKAMEWPTECKRGRRVVAGTLLLYEIAHYGGDGPETVYRWAMDGGGWSDAYKTYEAAKAAAQADYERRILSALEPATPEGGQSVAYPKIMYCCEYCSEHNPEMCGHDRRDIYVTNDGRWLCDGCLDEEGISSRECSSPPILYTRPAEQAVTEAIQEIIRQLELTGPTRSKHCDRQTLADELRAALKAAMEAGHD